jgi:MFS transporter, ACS family, glucarate transporter
MPTSIPTPDTRYRWVVLILCWAAFTMTSVDRATWGPAAGSVGADLGVPVAGLGLFATTYYIGYVVSTAVGGFIADWVGARRTVGLSILLSGGFMLAFGEADTHTMGLVLQVCIGLCAGAEVGGGVKLITSWFVAQRRGFAMGVFVTATSLGLVVANAVVPRLIQSHSWRASYHLFGFTSIAIGVLCLILLRPGPLIVRREGSGRPDLRPLLHNRGLLLLALAGFGALWGTYGFVTWSNLLMVKGAGLAPVRAGTVVVIFGAVAVFSKPLIGLVGDALGLSRRRLTVAILAAFTTCLIAFSFATTATQFLWIAPFLGIAAYVYSPVMMAMIPTLSGGQLAGSATGGVNAVWQLGSTIVPTVVGLVYGATGSFQAVFLVLAAGPFLAIVPMLFLRQADIHEQLPAMAARHHDNDHPLIPATNGKADPS